MKKAVWIFLAISIVLNFGLYRAYSKKTPIFLEYGVSGTGSVLTASGMLAWEEVKTPPIEHYKIQCSINECILVTSDIIRTDYVTTNAYKLEIKSINLDTKEADLVFKKCLINIKNDETVVSCNDGTESARLIKDPAT